jgi:hypothetical protein
MQDIPPDGQLSPAQSAKFLAAFNASCLPPPTTVRYRQPIHLCAWKIESPSRVVVYTGKHPPPSQKEGQADLAQLLSGSFAPHTLSKVLLDERSKRPVPSAIHLLATDQEFTPAAIRESVLHYAQTQLAPHKERVSLLARSQLQHQGRRQQQHVSILDHTLEEATAVFIHPPTRNHSEIALNQSPPWDKDHVDSR